MNPIARICLTGSELTRGETRDANGPFLATALTSLGLDVAELRLVPDDPEELARAFRECMATADVTLVSGGLGPTSDDHTVRVLASVLGRAAVEDPEARRRMRERVIKRVPSEEWIPDNFYKQAEVVEGCTVLLNPIGLAPGSLVPTERGFVVVMPGVPRELRAMFHELVVPRILQRFELAAPRVFRAKVLGIGESWAEARIHGLDIDLEGLEYGISARPGELLVKLIARRPEQHAEIDRARELLQREFGHAFVLLPEGLAETGGGVRETDHSLLVHELLLESGRTIATAESCTGGMIARSLTDHPGSSRYFIGSVVAYHDDVKVSSLGVPREMIDRHGAVSEEVCRAMALGALERFASDLALAVTGIAGPGGATEEKPVGLVFVGLASRATDGEPEVRVTRSKFWGDRPVVRHQATVSALEMVRQLLTPGNR